VIHLRGLAASALLLAACAFDSSGLGLSDPQVVIPDAALAPDAAPPVDAVSLLPPCESTDPDLVACYRFEPAEHGEQPFDESQYANHGTATGVAYTVGPPGAGQALLVGSESSVRIPDSASLDVTGALTLELWIHPRALPTTARAGLVDENGQYGLFLASDGTVRCSMGVAVVSGLAVAAERWTHIACCYDGATVELYQDGVLGATEPATTPLTTAGTDGLALGQNSPSGDLFDGALDEVRIWRTRRSAAQICADAGC
jgi:hypothetical protein